MTTYSGNVPEDIVLDLVKLLPPNSRVLDLGCGVGRNAFPLAHAGHCVEGRDNEKKEIEKLLERANAESVTITTIITDIRDIRIRWMTWNAILAILILNQLTAKDGETMLKNAAINVLPEGYLALVTFTNKGDLARLFPNNYYPPVERILDLFASWEVLSTKLDVAPCKTKDIKSGISNERITLLARKPPAVEEP